VPSLVADGLLGGVGSVVVFLPNILILFLFIALLEDSGYMARAAFVMDRVMHFFGLHGKSFIPLFMGFGCNIPAIMATRSLGHRKDRLLTLLAIPFMSCSARLTVFVLVSGVFFPTHQGLVLFLLYSAGVALAMVVSRLLKNVAFKEDVAPLIMELPPYKLPRLEWIAREMLYRARIFLRKAGTLILFGSLLLWMAASLPFSEPYASEHTLIGRLGQLVAPLLEPAGLGTWQLVVALLVGTIAKEMVVSTMATLYGVTASGLQAQLATSLTAPAAAAFMVLVLLYVPCLSTLVVLKRESGSWRWMALSLVLGVGLGYLLSVLVYQVGSRLA
jgi:ferrous iron transport protein B